MKSSAGKRIPETSFGRTGMLSVRLVRDAGFAFWISLIVALLLWGCGGRQTALGRSGIVTLSPALTEVVFALGRGDRLVGTTTASDYPPEALRVPRVSDYRVNVEAVVAASPELILADLTVNNPGEIQRLRDMGMRVEAFSPRTLADVAEMIRTIGRLLDAAREAETIAGRLERPARKRADPPRVLFTLGKDGLYVAGGRTITAELVRKAGGLLVGDSRGAESFYPASREAVLAADPEVILTTMDPAEFLDDPLWAGCAAVRNRAVFRVDPSLCTRPGPRLAEGIDQISRLLDRAGY